MIYDIVNATIYVILAQLFCSAFLKREEHNKVYRGLITILWIMTVLGASSILEESLAARVLIALLINAVYALVLYEKKSIIKCISITVLFYIMALASDMFVMSIHKYLDPGLKVADIMESDISVYMGAVSQFIQIIIVFVIRRLFREMKTAEIQSKLWMIYLVFPLYSLSLVVLLVYSFDGPISTDQAHVFTYMAVSLLLINLFIYWFIRQESQRVLTYQKTEMEIGHAREIAQLYDQITTERDILGKREHEFKNVITVLQGLYADEQYDKMKEILDIQNTELINNTNVFETGNRLVNTILNTKYAEARDKDIVFRFVIGDLSKLNLEDRDLIVILSNMINNAMEATEKCLPGNRIMNLKAAIEDNQFVFAVRNTCDNKSDPGLISTKKDVIPHGYGIQNIQDAVNRNNGNYHFEKRNDEFVSVVIIPL